MNLFNKEKDFILKITNLVLVISLISALTIFYVNIINYCYKPHKVGYKEYKGAYCLIETKEEEEIICKQRYESYIGDNKTDQYYITKTLITSLGSIIIISSALYLLNRRKGANDNEFI